LIHNKRQSDTRQTLKNEYQEGFMAKPEEIYQCQTTNCGYLHDPDRGDRKGKIPKGTRFEDLPDDWKCPVCGASKKAFRPLGEANAAAGS